MDMIIFGTGKIGTSILPFLGKNHHILFFIDNDAEKCGTAFGKYRIESPQMAEKYDCPVVIASTKYDVEMAEQLIHIGIKRERIYFCRRFQAENRYEYDIYPLSEERIQLSNRSLTQYDMFCRNEYQTSHKKVLILCTFFSTYTKQLVENISKRYKDIEFSILTNAKEYKEELLSEQLRHIYYFQTMSDLKTILEQLPVYDAMQLLWIEKEWAYFHKLIRKKTVRLNLNVGGSDFYRTGKGEKEYKKNLIDCADTITAETETTVREFQEYYGSIVENKMGLLPFGIEVLERIDRCRNLPESEIKKKYHIPHNKIVITCGHNANDAHQHMEMIEALRRLPENGKEQIVCVFPMTYPQGRETYIQEVERRLKNAGLQAVILTDFMDFQAMAEYALISDIMIHVQKTDQLSSTMLEEMYAGSIVIAGAWLPYQSLHDKGIFFLDVDRIADVTETLKLVIADLEGYRKKCERNKDILWKHSSWDELAVRWHALWDEKTIRNS